MFTVHVKLWMMEKKRLCVKMCPFKNIRFSLCFVYLLGYYREGLSSSMFFRRHRFRVTGYSFRESYTVGLYRSPATSFYWKDTGESSRWDQTKIRQSENLRVVWFVRSSSILPFFLLDWNESFYQRHPLYGRNSRLLPKDEIGV